MARPSPDAGSLAAHIRHPLLKDLFAYWQKIATSDGIIPKGKFDPVDLPAALWPRLHMIDIPEQNAPMCRNRLLGTYVVDAVGFDFTGRRLIDAEIPGVSCSVTYKLLEKLLAASEPQHYFGPPSFAMADRFATHEQILLPLTDETGGITAAVGALDYQGFSPGLLNHRN